MNRTIKEAIELAQRVIDREPGMPSLFTGEDVMALLKSLTPEPGELPEEEVHQLTDAVRDAIAELDTDSVVDMATAEFSIRYGNTVELDSIDVNTDYIADVAYRAIKTFLTNKTK